MRTIFIFLFALTLVSALHAQTVCYAYDAAGNRITKIIGPCNAFLVGPDEPSTQQALPHQQLEAEKAAEPGTGEQVKNIKGKVFPNPNHGPFSLVLDEEPPIGAWFELNDSKGSLLNRFQANGTTFTFDLGVSPAGEYYLFLRTSGNSYGQWKVIKE